MNSIEWATPEGGAEYVDEDWIEESAPDGNERRDVGFYIGDGTVIYGSPQQLVSFFTRATTRLRREHPDTTNCTRFEAIAVRDPDSDSATTFFADGISVDVQTYSIDAGAGWTRSDWNAHVDDMLANASPPVRRALEVALADVPGQEHISDE